eukprot:3656203-Lingulodinium_polyedra.AAC.1
MGRWNDGTMERSINRRNIPYIDIRSIDRLIHVFMDQWHHGSIGRSMDTWRVRRIDRSIHGYAKRVEARADAGL